MAFPRFRSFLRYIFRTWEEFVTALSHQHRKDVSFWFIYPLFSSSEGTYQNMPPLEKLKFLPASLHPHLSAHWDWWILSVNEICSKPSCESFFPSGPWIKGRWAKSGMVHPLGSRSALQLTRAQKEERPWILSKGHNLLVIVLSKCLLLCFCSSFPSTSASPSS